MKDHERLGAQGAQYVKPEVALALRHLHNGNLAEVFHVLSRLELVCYRALRPVPDPVPPAQKARLGND
jgi:hypothetical protein